LNSSISGLLLYCRRSVEQATRTKNSTVARLRKDGKVSTGCSMTRVYAAYIIYTRIVWEENMLLRGNNTLSGPVRGVSVAKAASVVYNARQVCAVVERDWTGTSIGGRWRRMWVRTYMQYVRVHIGCDENGRAEGKDFWGDPAARQIWIDRVWCTAPGDDEKKTELSRSHATKDA
jgi:hypothetical protein